MQRGAAITLPLDNVEGDAARGEQLFAKECASCHGAEGEGESALSLRNPLFLATASDAFIRYAIVHGRDGTPMPAFEKKLSDRQIDDVTHFIRTWARNVSDSPLGETPPPPDRAVVNPDGPSPGFSPLREGRYVPVDEVKEALDAKARMVLIDARPTSDWHRSHIPGAIPLPYYADVDTIVKALPRDGTWIIAYCACPHAASGRVMDMLRSEGFKNTAVLDEGVLVWTQRGYPLTYGVKK
jgi:rhodanese-related sulfurtransferase/cytochrome c553